MDKGQKQQRVPHQQHQQGDKTSPCSKQTSKSSSASTSASQRVKSWNPHSKINKILSNLERSILNQFNGHNNGSSSGSSGGSSSSSSSLIKSKSQAGRLSASSIGPPSSISTETSSTSLNSQQQQQQQQQDRLLLNNNKRQHNAQQQKDSTSSGSGKGITLQMKSEPTATKVKTTLNKYQQQIVSTMRPNHQLMLNNSSNNNIGGINNNNKLNNKLSIPPPHANDEARNQNHRIIFGASAITNSSSSRQSSDSNVIGSSATLKPSTSSSNSNNNNRLTVTRIESNSKVLAAEQEQNNNTETNLIRYNASPASSAKSLPTLATKQPIGSQNLNKSINEDEESGFSTYQSRRSLFTNNNNSTTGNNTVNISTTNASLLTGDQNHNNCNNMILMQTQTQVPIGALNFQNSSSQPQQQQMFYNYQFPQMNHYLQQQTVNTQQQVFANNQVPITSTTTATIDHSNKNCYPNHHSQQIHNNHQHHHISNTQRLNQSQFSDQNPSHNTPFQQALAPPPSHHQLFSLYPNGMQVPVSQQADSGQEIYANAPPKPRRYQYYDPTNSAHLFPQMITTMTSASSAMTSSSISNSGNSNGAIIRHQQQQPMFNRQNYTQFNQPQQQLLSNQPIYNVSYLQMPNLYSQQQQQQNLPFQLCNQQQIPFNSANFHEQQRSLNQPPYPLTKSKSSLDANDLIQYKLDAQSRSNTLRLPNQHRQNNQSQQRQLNYGSRVDNSNFYPSNTMRGQQHQQQPFLSNNLQRSKSVSHLLQPDYDRQLMNHQQRDLFIDKSHHTTTGPKFLSVSSASTTNLNIVGLTSNQQKIAQQNQIVKVPNQVNNTSHNQPTQPQYNDLVQQQGNQLFSNTAQRQHQQRLNNNWHQQNQASANCNEVSNQQRQRAILANKTNSAFSNCGKTVRQQQTLGDKNMVLEDGFNKQTLDDKIRYLMIGDDSTSASNSTGGGASSNLMVKSSNQNDNTAIYHQSSNDGNLCQKAWVAKQQQLSVPAELSGNENSLLKHDNISNRQQNANVPNNSSQQHNTSAQRNIDLELTNRIYINETNMGNCQQRQYQVNDINHLDSPSTLQSQAKHHHSSSESSENVRFKNQNNSQLIVDLTTPRVLAKTQTTISSVDLHANAAATAAAAADTAQQRKDSCSINQVGLPAQPPPPPKSSSTITSTTNKHKTTSDIRVSSNQPQFADEQTMNNEFINKTTSSSTSRMEKAPIFERTAPYYYSDLKSEEQRQALLSIVQQKSLSPPPQLLSRSTDQSSTRLTAKSATLHPSHMRMLGGINKEQRQNVNGKTGLVDHQKYYNNDFSSTSNIAKNIDKLFDSPAQPRISAVQSMLALNEYNGTKDNLPTSQLSNFQATSEAVSIGYFSGDMNKSKNFSKSKSLENINQGFDSEASITCCSNATTMTKTGNPVYQNICRTDKLMSAIKNSTTCLSNSASRSCRKPNINYLVENQQQTNSEESTDSILGSSLDESDSSLDLIDEIKISPTDNHISDISQLIEQLKINHSKLSEEYKSTLIRIAKTINTKNKQTNGDHKNDKLSRRLQLLELKSKKCESRSKNQLALIQMMEKVLKQSKARAVSTATGLPLDNASGSSSTEVSKSSMEPDQLCSTSPSLSFDYQNIKRTVSSTTRNQAYTTPNSSNSTSTLNSQHSLFSGSEGMRNNQPSIPSRFTHNIVKAVVTEKENQAKFISESKRSDETNGQISLSTRHHQQSLQDAINLNGGNSVLSLELRKRLLDRNTNPFKMNGKDDDDDSSSSSESSVDEEEERNALKLSQNGNHHSNNCSGSNNNNDITGLKTNTSANNDEEDFIEFLTLETSNHSQFGASQFSASDFDSSRVNSNGGDELRSSLSNSQNNQHSTTSKNHMFSSNGGGLNTTGILKSAKNGLINNGSISNNGMNENNNNNNNNGFDQDSKDSNERSKFNNVLGNVIDVDICPKLSQNSPVNNQASCLN